MRYNILLFIFTISSCSSNNSDNNINSSQVKSEPQRLIDNLIEKYGGQKYLTLNIEYDFRDIHYIATRDNGIYSYERIINDTIHDKLTNEGFTRLINGKTVNLIDTMSAKYARSVNSVHYFTLLPYGLNDSAVNKKYLGESVIEGKKYDKIHIDFDQDGGGEDHQDDFIYWINKETGMMDYFGYIYDTDGGGGRMRKAYNARKIGGIIFQDYINYKPKNEGDTYKILSFDSIYNSGGMKILSEIEIENIVVK